MFDTSASDEAFVSHRCESSNRTDGERRSRQINRRKRTYTGVKKGRDRGASFSFFFRIIPRASSPFLHSVQHPLTSRPRTASVSIDWGTSWREQRRGGQRKEGCWTHGGKRERERWRKRGMLGDRKRGILDDRKRGIWGGSPILGYSRVQCRMRICILH